MAGKRTDLDVWAGHPSLPILEAADRAGLSDREALGRIRAAQCPDPPPTQHGQARGWTVAVVASARQHLRRRAAPTKAPPSPPSPPPPPSDPPPASDYDHAAALRQVMLEQHERIAGLTPEAAAAWLRSRPGRAAQRRMVYLQLLSSAVTAAEDRAGANSAKLADTLVKLGALTEPDEDLAVTPGDVATDAESAAYAILDTLPDVVGVVGLDAVLAAVGRREHHTRPL